MNIKLNLISPVKKEEISKKRNLRLILRLEFVSTIILIVFLAIMWSYIYILKLSLTSNSLINQEIEKKSQYEKIKDYEEKFKQVNSQISKIKTVENNQLYWSNIFFKLNGMLPSNIAIKSLATNDYAVTLTGVSDSRDNLIILKEKLEKEECFAEVNLPLSNLVDKDNVEFQIYFNINKDCLKRK